MANIAVLTSGGDAPGMNACIRAVVRAALRNDHHVYGILSGYRGLVENSFIKLHRKSVAEKINRGGTFLGTARLDEFRQPEVVEKAYDILQEREIDLLVVIGGDGSYCGALELSKLGMKVICIPATIDNDIASSHFTIGFDTAVNTVVEGIDKIRDTSTSHERCSIIEVMGRNCGDIALHSGIAVGAELVVTNETKFSYQMVIDAVRKAQAKQKRHALIVITENICDVVSLAREVERQTQFQTTSTILGYIQRGGTPSAYDRFIASALGTYAIECFDNNIFNVCLGVNGRQLYSTPIDEALAMSGERYPLLYDIIKLLK